MVCSFGFVLIAFCDINDALGKRGLMGHQSAGIPTRLSSVIKTSGW
jgi:hypothetical protein